MAVGEDFIDFVNGLLAVAGRRPGRSGDLNFGVFAFSRLTRQRAMRLAWRGRSSSASLRAWSLRLRRSALTRPSGGGAGAATGWGAGTGISDRAKKWMRGGCFAYFTRRWLQLREVFPRIEELEGGEPAPAALSDHVPLGHGPRRRQLHHKTPRRDDNQAPHGGFGGPQNPQHGAVEGLRNPRSRGVPSSPSMANRASTMP